MFFLARSALCIGLVAVAASTAGGPGLGAAVDGGTRALAQAAGQACLRSADCLQIGATLLAPALPAPAAAALPTAPPRAAQPRTAAGAPRRANATGNGVAATPSRVAARG